MYVSLIFNPFYVTGSSDRDNTKNPLPAIDSNRPAHFHPLENGGKEKEDENESWQSTFVTQEN